MRAARLELGQPPRPARSAQTVRGWPALLLNADALRQSMRVGEERGVEQALLNSAQKKAREAAKREKCATELEYQAAMPPLAAPPHANRANRAHHRAGERSARRS